MKRMSALLILSLLLLPVSPALGAGFPDVGASHWAGEAVGYLAGQNLIGGFPDGTFRPGGPLTRAQAASIVASWQGLSPDTAGFSDVPGTHWAAGAIGAVSAAGLMNGYPDGTFRPAQTLTRAEAAVVLFSAFTPGTGGPDGGFPDVPSGHWASGAIGALQEGYVLGGFPDGTFRPGAPVTRAEFSVLLARAMNPAFLQPAVLTARATQAVQLLMASDLSGLAAMVHPTDGVRISPYNYVQPSHLVFSAQDLPGLLTDPTVYHWGTEDGTGDPILRTAQNYFPRYLTDRDYTQPDQVVYNQIIPRGNMLYNLDTFWPNGVFVEFFVEGTAQYSQMDWRSLFVVLTEDNGIWYVTGLVHGEWTT